MFLIELYNKEFLWEVGNMLGMMLKVDENTSIHSRGNFSQFCVELDLSKELVPSFMVIGREFKLQYEGLHMIFFECSRYDHRSNKCPEASSNSVSQEQKVF